MWEVLIDAPEQKYTIAEHFAISVFFSASISFVFFSFFIVA